MNPPVHGVFHSQNVGLLNAKLSRVLDDYDPFFIRNCLRRDIEQSGLSGSRSATNKDGFAGSNLVTQEFGKRRAQGASSNAANPTGQFVVDYQSQSSIF
jgi:hypothetical protein